MGNLGLKILVGLACVVAIAAGSLYIAAQVDAYSDKVDDANRLALAQNRIRCDEYAKEAARREKGQIHKLNESDSLFALKWRACRDDFPGVY
jgi:hypothetical protein